MSNGIYTGTTWAIDFYDAQEKIIKTMTFEDDQNGFDAMFEALDNPCHPEWPDTAVRLDTWRRDNYRDPILGLDYGPGSVSRRFGGYVPRGTYQLGKG